MRSALIPVFAAAESGAAALKTCSLSDYSKLNSPAFWLFKPERRSILAFAEF